MSEVYKTITNRITRILEKKAKPVRIAINGIEGTGKTTFAEKLVKYLNENNFTALHVSIDGFHFNKAHRYKQGRDSAKGYYEDSYNEIAFVEKVLKLSQADIPSYISATHDLETDEYLSLEAKVIPANTIIVTDGAYLFKPIYQEHWDLKIYLKTDFNTALLRGVKRDLSLFGNEAETIKKFKERYHAASKLYLDEVKPESLADLIIDNTNFEKMIVL